MALDAETRQHTIEKIIAEISKIYDPELPVNIYDLGLIYGIDITDDWTALIVMTLTSPGCIVGQHLPVEVQQRVSTIAHIRDVEVNLAWDPPWSPELASEEARKMLLLMNIVI